MTDLVSRPHALDDRLPLATPLLVWVIAREFGFNLGVLTF